MGTEWTERKQTRWYNLGLNDGQGSRTKEWAGAYKGASKVRLMQIKSQTGERRQRWWARYIGGRESKINQGSESEKAGKKTELRKEEGEICKGISLKSFLSQTTYCFFRKSLPNCSTLVFSHAGWKTIQYFDFSHISDDALTVPWFLAVVSWLKDLQCYYLASTNYRSCPSVSLGRRVKNLARGGMPETKFEHARLFNGMSQGIPDAALLWLSRWIARIA